MLFGKTGTHSSGSCSHRRKRHALAPCLVPGIDRHSVARSQLRCRAPRCRRALHLAGLLVLPARQCLSDRSQVGSAIERAKRNGQTACAISLAKSGEQLAIEVGAGSGNGRILLIGFDHEHTTSIGRGENSGRTLTEANVVRSIRTIGQWSGSAQRLTERFPTGQDAAVVLESADGRIIGASRLGAGGST